MTNFSKDACRYTSAYIIHNHIENKQSLNQKPKHQYQKIQSPVLHLEYICTCITISHCNAKDKCTNLNKYIYIPT